MSSNRCEEALGETRPKRCFDFLASLQLIVLIVLFQSLQEYLKDNEDNRKRLAEYYSYNIVNETYWNYLKQGSRNLISLIDKQIKD